MEKEQIQIESMRPVQEADLMALTKGETTFTEEPKVKTVQPERKEKKNTTKKAASGCKPVRYIGHNPSYTMGRHRFVKDAVQEIEQELADYALQLDSFEEA